MDSGQKKPHPYYNTPEKIAKWKQGYINELLREHSVIDNIAKVLRDAGAELAPDIMDALAEIYAVNAKCTGQALTAAVKRGGINATFSIPTVKQAKIILEDAQPVMSKIAFSSLQDAPALIRRLQNEMTQAVLLGESQDRLIRRIADVMQDGRRRARRIAQTEGTRVQSQARYNTLKDGADMGINVARRWSTRMVNSRESHIALNGKTVGMDENFVTIAGNVLRYPGDPTAPAAEVVNCHCVVVPVVGKRGERLKSDGESGTIDADKPIASRPFEGGKDLTPGDRFMHDGQTVTFESWQGKAETIAGKGCRRKIDEIDRLQNEYLRFSNDWKKKKRWANVTVNGERGSVDIHWYEEPKIGRVLGKVKEDEVYCWFYPDG